MPSREQILEAIRANPKIPAPPQTVFRILEMTRNPETDMAALAEVIGHDGGLTAQLLRQANSALYGFPSPTSSVAAACMRLGLKRIRAAVVNQHVVNGLSNARPPGFRADHYWQAAFATSMAAHDLCGQLLPSRADEASTAGLLCDMGIGLLAYGLANPYKAVLDRWTRDPTANIETIEAGILGITHADVGAAVLTDWKLDPAIVEAVRHHHTPATDDFAGEHGPFARIAAAAVFVARIALDGSNIDWVEGLFSHLDPLTDAADAVVSRLLDDLVQHIQDSAQSMTVELGSTDGMEQNFAEFTGVLPDVGRKMFFRPMVRHE
ncbi:MAG: HDOD domain-containing protein [Phycisphaerae bacterium]